MAMQCFRFLPDPAELRREARWSGVSSVPDIGEPVQPSADLGAGTVTAYFVDNWRLGVLVGLELYLRLYRMRHDRRPESERS
jgi:hypothetical protein